jgi:hypothetical protein
MSSTFVRGQLSYVMIVDFFFLAGVVGAAVRGESEIGIGDGV